MKGRPIEINLMRYLSRESPLHRIWPGTKIICVLALGVGLAYRPSWQAIGFSAALIAVAAWAGRIPFGALPKLPPAFWGLMLFGVIFTIIAGGEPDIQIGGTTIAVGGLLDWLRLTLVSVVVILAAMLLGWTTRMSDVGPALGLLMSPLRLVRFPVDELVVMIALGVRCFPLLIDEMRVLYAARKIRKPEAAIDLRGTIRQTHDALVTAMISAIRRAKELAEAMDARGGPRAGVRPPLRLRVNDAMAVIMTGGAVAAIVIV